MREIQRNPYWMMFGKISGGTKVIVVRNGKKYFAANDLKSSKKEIVSRCKSRWEIETIFRALHSKLGSDQCQARKIDSQIARYRLCLMACAMLEQESFIQKKTIYQIKRNCSFDPNYADNILFRLNFQNA